MIMEKSKNAMREQWDAFIRNITVRPICQTTTINGLIIPFLIAEEAVDVMRIERRCAKEIEIACVFDDHEGTSGVSYLFQF